MKFRVRVDLSFDKEADAQLLMNYVKRIATNSISINEGEANEEISFVDYELCGHDEAKPCEKIERVVVGKIERVAVRR